VIKVPVKKKRKREGRVRNFFEGEGVSGRRDEEKSLRKVKDGGGGTWLNAI